jgi:hypothetical protein
MFEQHTATGGDHECAAHLLHALAGLLHVIAALRGFASGLPRARVQQLQPAQRSHRRGVGRRGVVVNQYEIRNVLVTHERCGVIPIAGSDRNDATSKPDDFVVVLAQLRGMFATMQSTEMAKEHEHNALLIPKVTEPMLHAGAISQRDRAKCSDIHACEV